ncbi:MAG: hypothetical protein HY858_00815 [Candidatus Solibacter usitatus]|nr:hypothetical protein [Candidatus Solibacter usitatus]
MTKLIPYGIAWAVLAVIVMVLAGIRRSVAAKEDDTLHLGGEAAVVEQQVDVAKKLEVLDRWGKILTVILAVSGAALACWWGYIQFTTVGGFE